jgi:hypothetical protein
MTNAAISIRFYSFYLFAMGAGMLLVPNILLSLLGFPTTTEVWIRMLGLFTLVTGIYYWYAAAHEQTAFFRATVAGRALFFVATIGLTWLFAQPLMLAAVGSIDAIGALWTWRSLRRDTAA